MSFAASAASFVVTEVFRWEKGEAANGSYRAGALALELCAHGLRGIFDDRYAEIQAVHVGALSKEMNGHDRFRSFGDLLFDLCDIDVVVGEVDVDEHRRRAQPRDNAGCREKRIRGDDHFVARADAENHQRDEQRIGAR